MKTLEEKKKDFERYVAIDGNGCWNWTGDTFRTGYGRFTFMRHWEGCGKRVRAHRLSYELYKGIAPGSLFVCHHCDNRRCVNPDHLFLGTVKDNTEDAVRKGRMCSGPRRVAITLATIPRGQAHYGAKLTEDDVREILRLGTLGLSHPEIASRFNVKRMAIGKILRGERWKHITKEGSFG